MLWHYTIWLDRILADRVLRPSTENVPDPRQHAVWFSKNPGWEATVKKAHPLTGELMTFTEMAALRIARIGVSEKSAPVDWRAYQEVVGMPRHHARLLERAAREWGASPKDWFVSLRPVPQDEWLAVQVWDRGRWCDRVREATVFPAGGERTAGSDGRIFQMLDLLGRVMKYQSATC